MFIIYFTNNKFFFKCDACGLQFNNDHQVFSSKAKNCQEEIFCSTSSKSLRSSTILIKKTNKQPKAGSAQRIHVMTLFSRQNQVVMPASLLLWPRARFSQRIIMNALCVSCLVNFAVKKVKKPDWLTQLITFSPCTYYI